MTAHRSLRAGTSVNSGAIMRVVTFGGVSMETSRLFSTLTILLLFTAWLAASDPKVEIREWKLPSRTTTLDNILVDQDGSVWYSTRDKGLIGHLDPVTGTFSEFVVSDSGHGIHGLAVDSQHNIWYGSPGFPGAINLLDPRTRKTTSIALISAESPWPDAVLLDLQGNLWFTLSNGHSVGRLELATKRIEFLNTAIAPRDSPAQQIPPGDIARDSKGILFIPEYYKLVVIDPVTMNLTSIALPNQNVHPRRLTIASDDVLWYTDYNRGYLGKFDAKSGQFKEWLAPGGSHSKPYGITSTGNSVWFAQSGTKPRTIVRFDPEVQNFQSWELPICKGEIRHATASAGGDVWLPCSRSRTIIRVHINE